MRERERTRKPERYVLLFTLTFINCEEDILYLHYLYIMLYLSMADFKFLLFNLFKHLNLLLVHYNSS